LWIKCSTCSRIAVERLGARLTEEVEQGEYRGTLLVHVVYALGREDWQRGG